MRLSRLAAQLLALGVWVGVLVVGALVSAGLGASAIVTGLVIAVAAFVAWRAERQLMALSATRGRSSADGLLHCSFCDKSQREVRKLIAGPTVYICDECVGLCNQILAENAEKAPPVPPPENVYEPPAGSA